MSPIKLFIEGLGWRYLGDCGCTPKRAIFFNALYPNKQMWVGNEFLEVRKKTTGSTYDVIGKSSFNNYEVVYDYWINK